MGDCVEQEIAERLLQQSLVDLHDWKILIGFDRDGIVADSVCGEIDRSLTEFSRVTPVQLGMDYAGLDAGHVQQVVNHAMEASQRLLDLAKRRLAPLVIADLFCQSVEARMHRRKRCLQLVRNALEQRSLQ